VVRHLPARPRGRTAPCGHRARFGNAGKSSRPVKANAWTVRAALSARLPALANPPPCRNLAARRKSSGVFPSPQRGSRHARALCDGQVSPKAHFSSPNAFAVRLTAERRRSMAVAMSLARSSIPRRHSSTFPNQRIDHLPSVSFR
jgi:hypothetical protein